MADLSDARPCSVDPDRPGLLSPLEAHWLRAGCELVSALCRPLSFGDLAAEVRRSYELDSLPSTGQWKQLELRLRDPIQIKKIEKSLVLEGRASGSVGQNLAVGYLPMIKEVVKDSDAWNL